MADRTRRAFGAALAGVLVLVGAVALGGCSRDPGASGEYRVAAVTRGPISDMVAATGRLQAMVTVDVGSQVSGLIKSLHADFNSEVVAGQIIARIDPAPFEALLGQARAELSVAQANVLIQQAALQVLQAELLSAKAGLTEAQREFVRRESLLVTNAVPESSVDTALTQRAQADAGVEAALARLKQQGGQIALAEARVQQAEAAVQQRELDLDYSMIRSPLDGVVISRNVDAGQTVAASLQAPVLFRIAEDLRRMEVNISVDEADIGKVAPGQAVFFTVDSYLDRTFEARVHQIRKHGLSFSNVVTYEVIAHADNSDELLLPGMTANVTIVVGHQSDAVQVPQAALRLRLPPPATVPQEGAWVWMLAANGRPTAVPVEAGVSDGERVAVAGADLEPGQQVIVAVTGGSPRP
jgi:HlyD family secretion protein